MWVTVALDLAAGGSADMTTQRHESLDWFKTAGVDLQRSWTTDRSLTKQRQQNTSLSQAELKTWLQKKKKKKKDVGYKTKKPLSK